MKENMDNEYCVICGETEPRTGRCGSPDPRALCNATPAATTSGAAGTIDTPMWRELLSQAGAGIPDDFNCTTYRLSALVRFSDKHTAAAVAAAREESKERDALALKLIDNLSHQLDVAHLEIKERDTELARLRAAFHVNMLRAFPEKSHAEIAAEIERAAPVVREAVDLHNAIMNLPHRLDEYPNYNTGERIAHKQGHRDARHAAAELTLTAPHAAKEAGKVDERAAFEEAFQLIYEAYSKPAMDFPDSHAAWMYCHDKATAAFNIMQRIRAALARTTNKEGG